MLVPALAHAGGVLDQTSPVPNGSELATFWGGDPTYVWQSQVKVGIGGTLAGVQLTLVGGVTMTVGIRKGAGWSTQPLLFQTVVPFQAQPVFVDTSAANIPLAVGDMFVIELHGMGPVGAGMEGSYVAPPGMPLYPEPLFLNGNAYAPGWLVGFQTYMNACSSPGAPCDDGNPCTTNDVCDASLMCAGTPVVCKAMDACHVAGTCDMMSGKCSNPAAADGTPCDDGNACTTSDGCRSGVCMGAPVDCAASDPCHGSGTCDPMTGMCSANPPEPDGTPCPGGSCMGGTCKLAATGSSGTGGGGTGGSGTGAGAGGGTTTGGGGLNIVPSGCNCRTAPDAEGAPLSLLLALGAAFARHRRPRKGRDAGAR
jgi:MYXO-CTERM domain-containing protein